MSDFLGELFNAPSGNSPADAPIGTSQFDARGHVNQSDVGFRSVISFGTIPNTIHAIVVPSVVEQAVPYTDWHPVLDPAAQFEIGVLCYGGSITVSASWWEYRKTYYQWVRKNFINSLNGQAGFTVVRDATNPTVTQGSGLDASISVAAVGNLLGEFNASDVNGPADTAASNGGGGFGGSFRHNYVLASNDGTGVFTAGAQSLLHFGSTSPASPGHMKDTYGNYRNGAFNPTPIETTYWDGSEQQGVGGNAIDPHIFFANRMGGGGGKVDQSPSIWNNISIDDSITGLAITSNTPGVAALTWSTASLLTPVGSLLFGVHWAEREEDARHGFGNRALSTGSTSLNNNFLASGTLIESLPHGQQIFFGVSIDRYLAPANLPPTAALGWPTDPRSATISVTIMSSP